VNGLEDSADLSEQQILRALELGREIGDLGFAELWAELYRRYPGDARLLVLCLRATLLEGPIPGSEPAEGFVVQAERIAAAGAVPQPLADLLAVGQLALAYDLRGGPARRLAKLRKGLPAAGDPDESSDRLRSLARQVLAEYRGRS